MSTIEPMEVDIESDFDNKENTCRGNVLLKTQITEKGHEELNVSDNAKLRYPGHNPSPMSRSLTLGTTITYSDRDESENGNLAQSFGPLYGVADAVIKSPKLPLKVISADSSVDNNRNPLGQSTLDKAVTSNSAGVALTVDEANDSDENISFPSSSSSSPSTPIPTTPTKDILKPTGSPIMRGLRSVLNIFRSSQSPITLAEDQFAQCTDDTTPEATNQTSANKTHILASTPIASSRMDRISQRVSPLKDSIVFNEELSRNDLQWHNDTTIIFSEERIPVHKLFQDAPLPSTNTVNVDNNINKYAEINNENASNKNNFNMSLEPMDVSYNKSMVKENTLTDINKLSESELLSDTRRDDSVFVDCESTFDIQNETELLKSFDNSYVSPLEGSGGDEINMPDDLKQNTEQSSETNLDKSVESVHPKSTSLEDITEYYFKSNEKLSPSNLKNNVNTKPVMEILVSSIENVEHLSNKQINHEENNKNQSTQIHPEVCSNSITYSDNIIPAPTSEHEIKETVNDVITLDYDTHNNLNMTSIIMQTTSHEQVDFKHNCDSENTLINSPENKILPTNLNLDLKYESTDDLNCDSTLNLNNANAIENNDFMRNDILKSINVILCQSEDFVNDALKRYVGDLENDDIKGNVDSELRNNESNVMLNNVTDGINVPEVNVAHTEQIPICNFDIKNEVIEIYGLPHVKSNLLNDNNSHKESVQKTAALSENQQEHDKALDQESIKKQTLNCGKIDGVIESDKCTYNVEASLINQEQLSVDNDTVIQECQDTFEQLNVISNPSINNDVICKETILETLVLNEENKDKVDMTVKNSNMTGNEKAELIKDESIANDTADQNIFNEALNLIENKQEEIITNEILFSSQHLPNTGTNNDLRVIKVSNERNSIELLGISQYGISLSQVNDVQILSSEENIEVDTLPLHNIADQKASEHTIAQNIEFDTLPLHNIADQKASEHTIAQSVDDTSNVHIQNPGDEEIVVTYNNGNFVSVHEGSNTELGNFDDIQSTLKIKTERKSTSSKHISKEIPPSINFEDIENPFATKSKMRMSPPPSSFSIEETDITKSTLAQHPNDENNDNVTSICEDIEEKSHCDNSSKICMSFETKKDVLDITNKQIEKTEQTMIGAVCNNNSDDNVSLRETMVPCEDNVVSCDKLTNLEMVEKESNAIITSAVPRQDGNVLSTEQSVYLSADASSGEGLTVSEDHLFELKKYPFNEHKVCESSTIRCMENENTFICQSEKSLSPETTIILANAYDIQIPNTQEIVLSSEGYNGYKDENKMKQCTVTSGDTQSVSGISMASGSTNNKDIVSEVNSEDEDTLEGPFLEVEDFTDLGDVNYDKADLNLFDDANVVDEHFEPGEMFIDANAFDFLMNQNGNNLMDNGKESLFLKFDPLCAAKANDGGVAALLRNTPIKVPPQLLEHHETSTLNLTFGGTASEESLDDLNVTVSQKPMMAVIPAVNNDTVVMSRNIPETPIRSNRQSVTFNSPAIAVIDQLISLSANNSLAQYDMTVTRHVTQQAEAESTLIQLRQLLAEREENIHHLRCESIELQTRLSTLQTQLKVLETDNEGKLKRINDLNETLVDKTKINKNMALVMEEYERTIAGLIADTEQEKKSHAEERIQLIKERDEQTTHLTSMEVSFSDLHTKYEKSKQIILSYKSNQDKCKTSLVEFEENLKKMQKNYELLKQHATAKLNHANQELEKINRAHESEVLKLNAMVKRKDVHINSLEETLIQKTKANEELSAICDELLNKV